MDGIYENNLDILSKLSIKKHMNLITSKINNNTNLFKELLSVAQKNSLFVSILINEYNEEDLIIGIVNKLNDSSVEINLMTEYGLDVGKTLLNINDCIKMSCDDVDCQILKQLYEK
jgi:peptide subunit release factor RF-3